MRQNRLAQAVNVDEAVLSKIINGFREPTAAQRKSIADFLQQDESWLFARYTIPPVGFKRASDSKPTQA